MQTVWSREVLGTKVSESRRTVITAEVKVQVEVREKEVEVYEAKAVKRDCQDRDELLTA